MRTIIYILILLIIPSSCSFQDSDEKWTEIAKSSSIEKYQDYLIENPRTENLTMILDSLRVFWERRITKDGFHNYHGNCILIIVNKNGDLEYEGWQIEDSKLKDTLKYNFKNPDNLIQFPDKKMITIEDFEAIEVSLGIVDLITDKQLNPERYSAILSLIKNSFQELRIEYSISIYNKDYKKLTIEQADVINKIVPLNIILERPIPPPPRPSGHSIDFVNMDDETEMELEIELEKK